MRAVDLEQNTILHLSAAQGDLATFMTIVQCFYDLVMKNCTGKEESMTEFLHAENIAGESVLYSAARNSHVNLIKAVLAIER